MEMWSPPKTSGRVRKALCRGAIPTTLLTLKKLQRSLVYMVESVDTINGGHTLKRCGIYKREAKESDCWKDAVKKINYIIKYTQTSGRISPGKRRPNYTFWPTCKTQECTVTHTN